MANHKSAIKRAIQNEARRGRNRSRKTRMKNIIKGLEDAINSNSVDVIAERLTEAVSVIDKTASKGVIHKRRAARKISRLTRRANNALAQETS